MKRLAILFVLMLTFPMMMTADSFASLWKKYDVAEQKDQPRTQISLLQQIASKASATKNYGHLLKAELLEIDLKSHISPDSLPNDVAGLRKKEQQAAQKDTVLSAVYASVLGHLYKRSPEIDEASKELSKEYYAKSMRYPDLLARHTAAEFMPFVMDGVDSRIFYDDLLHVVGFEAEDYTTLHRYYKEHGNRAAACITAFMITQKDRFDDVKEVRKSKYLQTLDSLINEYKDLVEAGELAIERYNFMDKAEDASAEDQIKYIHYALSRWGAWPRMNILRNAYTRLTLPSFQVDMGNGVQIPHVKRDITILSLCNIQELTMTVTRVNLNGNTHLNPQNANEYAQIKKLMAKEAAFSVTKRYVGLPNYQVVRDTITMDGLPIGVYLVEFTTNNVAVNAERTLLRVSDVFVMNEELPDNNVRFAVVSATTGKPLPHAKLHLSRSEYYSDKLTEETITCNEQGEAQYKVTGRTPETMYATTETDRYSPRVWFRGSYSFYDNKPTVEDISFFTDRRIYRPGQTVHVAAIARRSIRLEREEVLPGKELVLELRDANAKKIAEQKVLTDSYGTAAADFTLPVGGLTGQFSIRANHSSVYFSVEEYKRPTFQVEFDEVKTAYKAGDTVTVKGSVKSFAGVPVQGARVAYTISRRPSLLYLWRGYSNRDMGVTEKADTIVTDADGSFRVNVLMELPERKTADISRYYNFRIEATATDAAGETHSGSTSLPLGDKATAFTTDMPDRVERDSLKHLTFGYLNNAGQTIEGSVRFTIDDAQPRTVKANETVALDAQSLASGNHLLEAVCGTDTLRHKFVVFTIADTKPAIDTPDWFYQSATEFQNDRPVYVQMGASYPEQHIVYTVVSGDRLLESGVVDQSNALTTRAFTYRSEYGDGILLTCAWVKNGTLYEHSAAIKRPLPNNKLHVEWKTFRNKLTPGQQEEWVLRVTKPDGTPADARMMAVLYDKSLDMLRPHSWMLTDTRYLGQPFTRWYTGEPLRLSLYGEMTVRYLREHQLDFSSYDFREGVIIARHSAVKPQNELRVMTAKDVRIRGNAPTMLMAKAAGMRAESADNAALDDASGEVEEQPSAQRQASSAQVRENLCETAFFYPALQTDKDGNVELRFTLPESITTWRFMGLAHDRNMNNGSINGETVAKKTVMVQPNMPRFVRSGDTGVIAARVFNTSEKTVSGTAKLELIDPETDKLVYSESHKYKVEPKGTAAVSFGFNAASLPSLLVARVTASGKGYSDGEQHYLPVLSDKELVTTTVPFTQNEPGTKSIDLSRLFPVNATDNRLTIEYTNNPSWLMVQTLPSVAITDDRNAISMAAAYYANSIANNLLHQSPAIKTTIEQWKQETGTETSLMSSLQKNQDVKSMLLDETPWVAEANAEADQKQQLIHFFDETLVNYRLGNAISKLRALQNPDGSFSWWPDMPGSMYMTTMVTKILVRLNALIGKQQQTQAMIEKAFGYMDKQAARRVKELKKEEANGAKQLVPDDVLCDYLYANALAGRPSTADTRYLVRLLSKAPTQLTIYGKANVAVILAQYGQQERAKEYLRSLTEYTVYKEEMGRYFDTPKAHYSWFDYKIPTQVAAIEALKTLDGGNKQTIEQMQLWLLQAKRTQMWDTPINAVNAVYAFLNGQTATLLAPNAGNAELKLNGKPLEQPKATAGMGYVKLIETGKNMNTFTAVKTSAGTSWGAVYAQFMQQSTEVPDASAGLQVKREVIGSGNPLRVGDKVRIKITIQAERDYDFVQLQDKRAACLEPVNQLSGYHWGYYCAPKDNVTNYYFDRLSKGKHVIETDYYIDRAGTYQTGTCTVQCAYAPEYSARETAKVLRVE